MKTILVASAAAAALLAGPAFAQEAIGSVGVTYSNPSIEDADIDVWTVDGVVAAPLADWTVTVNANIDYAEAYGEDDTTGAVAGHLTKMWTPDVRAGGFVAANALGTGEAIWTVGAEAQKYLAGSTLTGMVAYTDIDDLDAKVWTVGGDAAFYVMPNLRLNAGVSYNNLDTDFGDVDAWTYGVGGEYEFTGTPFSITAGYTRADIQDTDLDVDTWSLGLRYSFGGGLQARDRAGAGLGGLPIATILGGL